MKKKKRNERKFKPNYNNNKILRGIYKRDEEPKLLKR